MRLDRVIDWLNGIGISSPDRLWQYRKNIRGMIDAAARGEMEQLIQTMAFDDAREIFSSYIEADELLHSRVGPRFVLINCA